jgi:small subunit ribosomal protein S6
VPTYETIFITSPTLTEEETETTVSMLAGVVTDGNGEMIANEKMGRRRLAYPISKFDDGVYTKFLYEAEGQIPKELDRRGRLADQVLRSLTVKLDVDWAADARVQAALVVQKRIEDEARAIEEAEQKVKDEAEQKIKDAAEAEQAAIAAAATAAAGESIEDATDVADTTDAPDAGIAADAPEASEPAAEEASAEDDTPPAETKEDQS